MYQLQFERPQKYVSNFSDLKALLRETPDRKLARSGKKALAAMENKIADGSTIGEKLSRLSTVGASLH